MLDYFHFFLYWYGAKNVPFMKSVFSGFPAPVIIMFLTFVKDYLILILEFWWKHKLWSFKTLHNSVSGSLLLFHICDNLTVNVALAVSCLAQRRCGPGCLVSVVSLRCFSSLAWPSCQNLPASCCWKEEIVRPVNKVCKIFLAFFCSHVVISTYHRNHMFSHATLALKHLGGNKDYSREIEEMLEEKAALQNVHSYSVLELIQNKTVRWQLITVFVMFFTIQLCGVNAVSFKPSTSYHLISRLCSLKNCRSQSPVINKQIHNSN